MTDLPTVLDVFRDQVANPETRDRHAVECGAETWTYDDLDVVSTGLALELEAKLGARPTVAIIAENLPYTFALFLAVWKLRGIVAPIDCHTPEALLQPMLKKVAPACVVIPSAEKRTQKAVLESGLPTLIFTPETTTMTVLCERFMEAPELPLDQYPAPDPTSISIYLFTSSASDVTNIKCVALTHQTILTHARSLLEWDRRTYPEVSFQHIRLLGWAPFSHMMAISDITNRVYLTGGCYIFGLTPSGYLRHGAQGADGPSDVTAALLQAMEKYRPESFAGVPWMFEGIMKIVRAEPDLARQEELIEVLRNFKLIMLGGAPTSEECIRWAREQQIPVILAIGMTELGGPLFHKVAEEIDNGWPIADSLIANAEFTLIDEDGNPHDSEGELYISSKLIATGYLEHDSSAFTIAPDGLITFKTGDRYARADNRLKWLGRKDDFIILISGEMVDPRVLENSLDSCPSIARSCVIGNKFLRGSADFLCALVEVQPGAPLGSMNIEISRAIRAVNRALAPPLRISWSRVLILEEGQQIPINRKGQIWRKKLEALYGNRVGALSGRRSDPSGPSPPPTTLTPQPRPSEHAVRDVVLAIVVDALSLSLETLELNAESTFAELGMDSAAALVIVGKLNERFTLNLPRNACHTHVDLNSLTAAILECLEKGEAAPGIVQATFKTEELDSSSDVVIVGQAIRLPGDLNTPESFWEALVDMREDLLVPMPSDRWDHASFFRKPGDPSGEPCDINFEKAGFVEIAHFDNAFFGISSAEALFVIPAVRLVLETTFKALENANIPSSRLRGSETGVFVAGGIDNGYLQLLFASMGFGAYSRFSGTGTANSSACGRLSYLLDVHGPSVSVDTACSGGMVAFDQAVQYLRTGKAETAIVCGSNTHTWPGGLGFLSAQKMCSPNSRCATFSSDADGYVPAEGAVSLILRTRRAALRDGDTILAVIKATDTKHNGKSQGLVAPSAAGQAALQRSLIAAASLSPADIDFVEAHGTGTSLGDLIEIEGINTVFRGSHTPDKPLILGAAKACIGHTEVAAGLVGIVKAIKQVSSGKVAGLNSLSAGTLNPEIDTTLVPLLIPSKPTDLHPRSEGDVPYRALVVAYGFTGTLSGTVLEAPPPAARTDLRLEPAWMIFALSAKSNDALHRYMQHYLDFCANAPETDFRAICYTSCVGRELYRHRFICVVKDLDGLVQRLKDRLSQTHASTSHLPNLRLILAFPGQGSQFYGMAGALAERFEDFKTILMDAASMASSLVDFDALSLLLGQDKPTGEIDKSAIAQICIFVYQYSVCQFLRKLGVRPDAVIGNSLGEISAAVEAGALSYKLGLQFVVARAKFLSPYPDRPAGMVAVAASEATISQCIHDLNVANRVAIAVFSSPENHVVSGDLDAIGALVAHVKKIGIRAALLTVDQAFHSHCIERSLPELEEWIENHRQEFRPLEKPLFSTVLGKQIGQQQSLPSRYWVDHARDPVYFYQAASQIREDRFFKNACILDVGPTPTAWAALQSNSIPDTTLLSCSAKKGKDQELAFLSAIANLTECGVNPDFLQLFGSGIPKTDLPTYPFQRQRHYPSFIPSRSIFSASQGLVKPSHPPLVVNESLYEVLNDHRIQGQVVLPGAAMVDALARSRLNESLDIRFHRPLVLESPGRICNVEFAARDAFVMFDGDKGDKLCSGKISRASTPGLQLHTSANGPARALNGEDVYASFGANVQFGPLFRNIVSYQSWDNYAEGLVIVAPSSNPENDRIRALDACIHMFGACGVPDKFSSESGAFLPMALEGFVMYAGALPSSFICRYRLPIVRERNDRVASTAFEVLSQSGELLAFCAKYSATWIDMGIPSVSSPVGCSFQQVWIPKELGPAASHPSSKLVLFGRRSDADWINLISRTFGTSVLVDLDEVVKWRYGGNRGQSSWHSMASGDSYSHLLDTIDIEPNSLIVLDVTFADSTPESAAFSAFWQRILWLMKALGRNKMRPFTLVVVSTIPVASAAPPGLGPMIQGMLRVFRREVGLENAYGIEIPGDASADLIAEVLEAEFGALRGITKENMVSYRKDNHESGLMRFVPKLRESAEQKASLRPSGVAVIVGMGSIGSALGRHMIAVGVSTVVFLGRRPAMDEKVAAQLSTFTSGQFSYIQADVSDLSVLRRVLQHIISTFGAIKSILHTAAVVSDATIDSISVDAFTRVLHPKVCGAYNLHILAEELAPELECFVLFSSVSVPLGNPGQVAYVAANSYLDALATHRRRAGRPGVSLQLGPWESELVDNLRAPSSGDGDGALMRTMRHKDGLPLIMRALAAPEPVQVIAALDTAVLSQIPAFATDSLFAALVAAPMSRPHSSLTGDGIAQAVIAILRSVLELTEGEPLELNESLTSCGLDSIAFGQIRGKVLKQLGVDVPLLYLSDAFTINDMIANVQENCLMASI
ncbi:hypothetical protein FB451DRAFT_1235938 [Mycena latifolia]|nr:hypothetical protein FB451DRAFT_1235938 [Mycena latifolia]